MTFDWMRFGYKGKWWWKCEFDCLETLHWMNIVSKLNYSYTVQSHLYIWNTLIVYHAINAAFVFFFFSIIFALIQGDAFVLSFVCKSPVCVTHTHSHQTALAWTQTHRIMPKWQFCQVSMRVFLNLCKELCVKTASCAAVLKLTVPAAVMSVINVNDKEQKTEKTIMFCAVWQGG